LSKSEWEKCKCKCKETPEFEEGAERQVIDKDPKAIVFGLWALSNQLNFL